MSTPSRRFAARCAAAALALSLLAPVQAQDDDALEQVRNELADDSANAILRMQLNMLSHARGEDNRISNDWRWARTRTNLRNELLGAQPGGNDREAFSRSAALLTGQRAIDESLQLGSIGVNRVDDDRSGEIPVGDVELVDIPSHPWNDMVAGRTADVPAIAALVPHDMLFVHVIHPAQFLELEKILEQQSELVGDVYGLAGAVDLKEKMMQRLGIPDIDAFVAAVDELAFVSDDLSFMPRTDYALVLKPVNAIAEKGFEAIVSDRAIYRKVGEHIVVATHAAIVDRIEHAAQNGDAAMAGALDYHYALLNMEPQRDGLIYMSEAFIRKLTGPAYRINARRRNTVLDALETLQYGVFAYRRIHGEWPGSFDDMVARNYIKPDAVYAPENYRIDDEGRIVHDTWGSLWSVVPVGQVPISTVSTTEKRNYERFSAGYQSFFREFFDPVGIAYTISDQLYLHTLILPLIDNSDYRQLSRFFGGETRVLSFLFDAERLGAINVAANFSIDNLLVQSRGRRGEESLEGETEEARRERLIRAAEEEISSELFDEELAEGERLLDFIGDEFFLGVGERNSFSISNIADIDVWFGVQLNDHVRAEAFFKKLWTRIANQFSNAGMGMFSLSSTEPLSNEYNGQKYYMLPTGFINVFYIFYEDAFYLTISQVAMNRIIDAHQDAGKADFSKRLERGFAHVGAKHNIVAALDFEKVSSFEMGADVNVWGKNIGTQLKAHYNALNEAMTLAEILPGYDGTLQNTKSYYRMLPDSFYGTQYEVDDGALYLRAGEERVALADFGKDPLLEQRLYELLTQTLPPEKLRERLSEFRSAVLGMSFIPDGLEVKLSIGNPNRTEADARFSFAGPETAGGAPAMPSQTIAIVLGILVVVIFVVLVGRRRKQAA